MKSFQASGLRKAGERNVWIDATPKSYKGANTHALSSRGAHPDSVSANDKQQSAILIS